MAALDSLRDAEKQLEQQLAAVRSAIASIGGVPTRGGRRGRPPGSKNKAGRKRRKMSAEARAKIAAAQKKRWAKQKGEKKKTAE